ncbi:MAG: hypothetical protein ACRDGU_03895 [Actinomycetota bacterium]
MATLSSRLLAEKVPEAAGVRDRYGPQWRTVARAAAVLTLIGSAVIHFSQVGIHLEEWSPAGITFVVLAGAELVLATAILVGASRPAYLAGIWVSQATILVWLLSRTVGIPFGPEAFIPEPVGRPDLIASALEAITMGTLFALFLSRPAGGRALHLSGRGYLAVGMMASLVGVSSWFAVLPEGGCEAHGASESLTGPLIPIDGHSILGRDTPVAEANAGQEVGLVVGLLDNCGSSTLTIRSARLTGATNFKKAARPVSLWVVPSWLARPGRIIPAAVLKGNGTPLPGEVEVEPAGDSTKYPGLVLLLNAAPVGDFWVNAIEVTYTAGGRTYVSPYATIARLRVSETSGKGVRTGMGQDRVVEGGRIDARV